MRYRILLLTPYLQSRRGNSFTALRLRDGLTSSAVDVHIISLENDHWQDDARHALASGRWDLLHGLHATSVASAISMVPELQSLPLLLTMTGTDLNYGLSDSNCRLTALALNQARRLVVFNDYYLDLLGTLHPDWGKKVHIIPQGVALPPSPPLPRQMLGLSDGSMVFLLSAGLRPVKNIELALEGLRMAYEQDERLQLLLVGSIIDPAYGVFIKDMIDQLPWAVYGGEYPHHDIAGIIQQCDAVLNTSHHEGQPQAVLEAMSVGLPCLLNAVPGNLGLIKNGQEGYYFHTAAELAEKALCLMENDERRLAMGQAAQQLIRQQHDPAQEIEAYLYLYDEIINSTGEV